MTLEELKKFCADRDDIRYHLCEPCTVGDYTYATNGHLIIRSPKFDGVEENSKFPSMDKVFDKAGMPGDFVPVPTMAMPLPKDCDHCEGRGEHECTCGDNHECHYCDGTGKVENIDGHKIGNCVFAKRYLAALQGWEIAPNSDITKAAHIRNGELIGLLMPMRTEK